MFRVIPTTVIAFVVAAALATTVAVGSSEARPRRSAPPEPKADARFAYWFDRVVDLEDLHIEHRLSEPAPTGLEDGDLLHRVVGDRTLSTTRLEDGTPVREFQLRGQCRRLYQVASKLYAVLEKSVEVFSASGAPGVVAVEFMGRGVLETAQAPAGVAAFLDDTSVYFVDGSTPSGVRVLKPAQDRPGAEGALRVYALSGRDVICRAVRLEWVLSFDCVDHSGKPVWSSQLPHTEVIPRDDGGSDSQTIDVVAVGRRHLLLGTGWDAARPRTVLLDGLNGERLMDLPQHPGALLESTDGALKGVVVAVRIDDGDRVALVDPAGQVTWTVPGCRVGPALTTLEADDSLIVACHSPLATGAELFSLKLSDGERRWSAEVGRLSVGHSKYRNAVALRRKSALVLLEGRESAGEYVQVFRLVDGSRRFMDVHHRW